MQHIQDPFSIQHLPYGIVEFHGKPHLCVRLGDLAISLEVLRRSHLLTAIDIGEEQTLSDSVNPLLKLPTSTTKKLRQRLTELLARGDHHNFKECQQKLRPYPEDDPAVKPPLKATDFVDFYCSRHHAFRVGCLFRGPENALPEQYFNLPIGYHGRTSTLFSSGQKVPRPQGIRKTDAGLTFGPTQRLDFELELGFVLREQQGRVGPDEAKDLIFGVVLVNDWSARDIQAFEYKPLGPFLGKSFATSYGAWITPLEALEPWCQANTDSDHETLPHLSETGNHHWDLPLMASLATSEGATEIVSRSNLKHLAWSGSQMVSHMSSNGTRITAGDLIATGTVSGPDTGSRACLLELTDGGKDPLKVGSQERLYLQDYDSILLLGGHDGVGLAPCQGTIIPAK